MNPSENVSSPRRGLTVALVGNPNTGKTSVFNSLTGLHQKVGNYPGVTVEKKTGSFTFNDTDVELIDLPGLYSLVPKSLDDKIASDILTNPKNKISVIDIIVLVADASNLNRNLYLLTQIMDIGKPVILALNMMDVAKRNGLKIDVACLQEELGVMVVPVVAKKNKGIDELRRGIVTLGGKQDTLKTRHLVVEEKFSRVLQPVCDYLKENTYYSEGYCRSLAIRFVSSDDAIKYLEGEWSRSLDSARLKKLIGTARKELEALDINWHMAEARLRYKWIDRMLGRCVTRNDIISSDISVRLDKILTHSVLGPLIFLAIFAAIFQTIFSYAEVPMNWIDSGMHELGLLAARLIPPGLLQSLVIDGVIAGVGAVLVFLPQILALFFFLGILEDTGYMSRVAFMMDRVMRGAGLSGRSVIPLLSSFACAIPGIMATRTVHDWKERLITILIAPFMSCSARLPVYVLIIGAFIPAGSVFGVISYSALTLLSLYLLGILAAAMSAYVFKKTIKGAGRPSSFVMELPPYRRPSLRWTALQMVERARLFVTDAGKIILAVTIVLWFLASFPRSGGQTDDNGFAKTPIEQTYAGRFGKTLEPLIKPLGFDWKIGIGLITSFAAREVMVSTLATIYNLEDADEGSVDLRQALVSDTDPQTGKPLYTIWTALSLLVYYVLAMQCMATVAIVKRETNSWRWPALMIFYMTSLAYLASFTVYQIGKIWG
ncbi:MAG TPA: ferrous iron transport protein B [Caldithrix abyssi]|uniref:Ferrous iron transport protein B n=1 Tax=Caldithrix abyssi TaxID=187145 RepID=A0A7V5RNK7_CALAY|nr:ferrous iron transport protein B [Caldithrix abyssi]